MLAHLKIRKGNGDDLQKDFALPHQLGSIVSKPLFQENLLIFFLNLILVSEQLLQENLQENPPGKAPEKILQEKASHENHTNCTTAGLPLISSVSKYFSWNKC